LARIIFIIYKTFDQEYFRKPYTSSRLCINMKRDTPTMYQADDCCVDCGKGVSPHQADTSRQRTFMSRALGDSRNRDGFVLCRNCLDKEIRDSRALIDTRSWQNNYTHSVKP